MSKNTNDINYLATKQRLMAAIAGKGYREAVGKSSADAFFPIADEDPEDEPAEEAYSPADSPAEDAYPEPPQPAALALSKPYPAALATPKPTGASVMAGYLAGRAKPTTRRTMFEGLKRLARLLNTTPELVPWHELRFEHTDALRAKLLGGAYAVATVEVTLEALKGVLWHAKKLRLMTHEEFDEATDWSRLPSSSLPPGRELPQSDIEAIQKYIASLGESPYGRFLEAAFALLLGTGLRAIEVCRASVQAFDPGAATIKVERKGGKVEELPLGDPEVRALELWLVERKRFEKRIEDDALLLRVHTNDWVRPKQPACSEKFLYRMCASVSKEAKIPKFSPHDLRRTFCTRALRQGDVLMVQGLMGHANTDTTRKYDRRSSEERQAARRRWNIWRPPESPPGLHLVTPPKPAND